MDLGWGEILFIGFVALLVYGGRLPEVARSVGRSVAALKKGFSETTAGVARDLDPGLDDALREPVRKTVRPAPRELATEDVSSPQVPAADGAGPAAEAGPPTQGSPTQGSQTQTGAPRR